MNKNFEVLLSEESKAFIRSLDIKIQKKITYNIQNQEKSTIPEYLRKLQMIFGNLEQGMIRHKLGFLHSGILT